MGTITAPTITGCMCWRDLTPRQQIEAQALVVAAGVPLDRTLSVTYDVIDAPLLRFELVVRDEDGHIQADPEDRKRILTETVERALPAPLPDWWQPATQRHAPRNDGSH